MTEEEFRKGLPEKIDLGRIEAMETAMTKEWEENKGHNTMRNMAFIALKALREYEGS